jgi:hypothetical protein
MATKTQILQKAASQIGTTESPYGSNRTKYGSWYGMNGAPWCDIFISWLFNTTGAGSAIGGKFAYVPTHKDWFSRHGRLYRTPSVGDVVFFRFPGMYVVGHIGIVEKVLSGGRIQTIEGNTSASGSQNNGGRVCRKIRSASSYVSGYGRPIYTNTAATVAKPAVKVPIKPKEEEEEVKPWFIRCKDGRIAIVTPTGVRGVNGPTWQVWQNLGFKIESKYNALDVGPFNAIVASLGGLVK